MPVAPSYQTYKQLGEPYEKGGKVYVRLEHPNTHNVREARFYTDQEYQKQYGNKASAAAPIQTGSYCGGKLLRPLKEVLGFTKGYITIFKGNTESLEEWFKCSTARFHNLYGWYFHSEDPIPDDLPAGITPIQLQWNDISTGDNSLKSTAAIKAHIDSLIYEPTNSKHIGSIGERLTLTLTLTKDIVKESIYGISHFYIFTDSEDNIFTWNTQAKVLSVGTTYSLKGTLKEHIRFQGEAQNVLTRCSILS